MLLFFGFIGLFQRRMPTNACKFIYPLKGEKTVKCARYNLAF